MIVDRYLGRAMAIPFLAGWLLLSAIFAAYVAASLLQDAAASGLAPGALWTLILLECVIAWEVILPTSMFFAVLFAFERMNRDRELIALFAGGWSRLRILLPVVGVGAMMVVLVMLLSVQARPWAYRTSDELERLSARLDVSAMQAGRFYTLGPSLVVTAASIDQDGDYLVDVFARQQRAQGDRLIRARRARLEDTAGEAIERVEFTDGQIMTLGHAGRGDRRHRFERLSVRWEEPGADEGLDRRAQPVTALWGHPGTRETAELQWRLTLPWLTFGMTLIAGVLGTAAPGRVTAMRMLWAITAYVVVFNVAAAARTAVENGDIGPWPGLLWLPLVPLALTGLILLWLRRHT